MTARPASARSIMDPREPDEQMWRHAAVAGHERRRPLGVHALRQPGEPFVHMLDTAGHSASASTSGTEGPRPLQRAAAARRRDGHGSASCATLDPETQTVVARRRPRLPRRRDGDRHAGQAAGHGGLSPWPLVAPRRSCCWPAPRSCSRAGARARGVDLEVDRAPSRRGARHCVVRRSNRVQDLSATSPIRYRQRHDRAAARLLRPSPRRGRPRGRRGHRPRARAPAAHAGDDRLGELRAPGRPRVPGRGADQQVRRGLPGQALLRRLRVRRRHRAARDRPREVAVRRRARQRPAARRRAGQHGRLPRAAAAGRHDHGPQRSRTAATSATA